MKKVLVFAVALMLSVLFALSACGTSTLDHKNGLSDLGGEVSSNGGFAVEKGDYVYFVNGIAASSDDNEYGKVETGACVVGGDVAAGIPENECRRERLSDR